MEFPKNSLCGPLELKILQIFQFPNIFCKKMRHPTRAARVSPLLNPYPGGLRTPYKGTGRVSRFSVRK